jgi:hypothetical protein
MIAGCPQHAPAPCGGTVDLIWINKANFKRLKEGGNAYGPWANRVPSAANFDWFSPVIAFDQGTPTQGYEMPYNVAQVVFFHNTNEVGFLQFLLGSSARSRYHPLLGASLRSGIAPRSGASRKIAQTDHFEGF